MRRPLNDSKIHVLMLAVFTFCHGAWASEAGDWKPLFNGKDLEGWKRINTDASTWSVQDGMLICTGKPIGELRTIDMYQNFILEVEWRHMKPRGNAGIFVWADDITAKGVPFHRGIEVQVLENAYGNTRSYSTHGDIFPIHGAKMTPENGRGGNRAFPNENRSRPSPEWNHYRIDCRDGDISLAVNGKVVTRGKRCSPSKGYICVESEGGVVHYRNMRIQVLPDTPVASEKIAIADRGYRCLYTGIDLSDWHASKNWTANDWQLRCEASDNRLETAEAFEDIGFLFDVQADEEGDLQFIIAETEISISLSDKAWHRIEGKRVDGIAQFTIDSKDGSKISVKKTGHARLAWRGSPKMRLANIYVRGLDEE